MFSSWRKERKEAFLAATAVILTALCLTPMAFPVFFMSEITEPYYLYFKILLLLIPFAAVIFCYKIEFTFPLKNKFVLFMLLVLVSCLLIYIHYIYVDITDLYYEGFTNRDYQINSQKFVMLLHPKISPHSFRFLPNSIVRAFEFLTGDFVYAQLIYRHTFMFLLVYSIYYYARIYCSHEKALLSILFFTIVYPISIRYYAGQLTDPLSHLSFALSFIFLEMNLFVFFALAIFTGILAKESILVMIVYYLLVRRKDKDYLAKSLLLVLVGAGIALSIRFYLVPSKEPINDVFVIQNLRETSLPHIRRNLAQYRIWITQVVFTVGIFIPFQMLAWRSSRPELKRLTVFLLPILLFSNLLFSWLSETRNLIPVVIPLAIIASDYLLGQESEIKESGAT